MVAAHVAESKFFALLWFFPRQHLLLMLSTHSHVNTPLTRACGLSVGTIKQTNAPSDIGQYWTEQYFHNVSSSIFDGSN